MVPSHLAHAFPRYYAFDALCTRNLHIAYVTRARSYLLSPSNVQCVKPTVADLERVTKDVARVTHVLREAASQFEQVSLRAQFLEEEKTVLVRT